MSDLAKASHGRIVDPVRYGIGANGPENSHLEEGMDEGGRDTQRFADALECGFLSSPPKPESSVGVLRGTDVRLFFVGKHALEEAFVSGLSRMPRVGQIDDVITQVPR